tara:strand:+ start:64364 stop:64723 length:360 start_codon:yes stop_codon:yes gene_type:complete
MKKVFVLLFSVLVLSSCKNNQESPQNDTQEIAADFIYFDDAAVLKGSDFIYGVKLDDKAKELSEKVAPVKKDEYDMVPVVVKGIINKREEGQEGWEEIFTITEIVKVSNRPSNPDVKLE